MSGKIQPRFACVDVCVCVRVSLTRLGPFSTVMPLALENYLAYISVGLRHRSYRNFLPIRDLPPIVVCVCTRARARRARPMRTWTVYTGYILTFGMLMSISRIDKYRRPRAGVPVARECTHTHALGRARVRGCRLHTYVCVRAYV